MSRGSTPRWPETWLSLCNLIMKLRGILCSSAILRSDSPQSNNRKGNSFHSPWEKPNVIKHAIDGYLRLPRPTPAPAMMRVLHWLRCWAEEPGYTTGNPPKEYGQIWGGWMIAVDYCFRTMSYTVFNRRTRSLMTLPGWGRKVNLLLAIILGSTPPRADTDKMFSKADEMYELTVYDDVGTTLHPGLLGKCFGSHLSKGGGGREDACMTMLPADTRRWLDIGLLF